MLTDPQGSADPSLRTIGLAPGRHSSEETSQRWRVVGDTVFDLTGPGFEPQISSTDNKMQNGQIPNNKQPYAS